MIVLRKRAQVTLLLVFFVSYLALSFYYLGLYVLGDYVSKSKGSFMQTEHACVLIHIIIKGLVGTVKYV